MKGTTYRINLFFLILMMTVPQVKGQSFEWGSSLPETEGFSSEKLHAMRDTLAKYDTSTLLVIRNDKIVLEWYAEGWHPKRPHGTASVAKALVGGMSLLLAEHDGRLEVNEPASKYIPEWRKDPMKSKITLLHLATHSSGIEDSEITEEELAEAKGMEINHMLMDAMIEPPYPMSNVIRDVEFAPENSIIRKACGSDTWPVTWADDDNLYTAYGDGWGFEPKVKEKLSLGLARISGGPEDFRGTNIRSETGEHYGSGRNGKKASGMLMVDGVLYMWLRNANEAGEHSQLAWSENYGKTWAFSNWKFTESFGYPTFLNFGKNYQGARDEYVYVYSHDNKDAYKPADHMVLARVPKGKIKQRNEYEFFKSLDENGQPRWTKNIAERGPVFTNPNGCFRSGITYNAGLKRYLWSQILPVSQDAQFQSNQDDMRFHGGFGIYEAPEPWGPWRTVYYTKDWDVGPGETSSIPSKWMSSDGKTCHLLFSGEDCFSVRKVIFETDSE